MKIRSSLRLIMFTLLLALLLTACGVKLSAFIMHLKKIQGTVDVSDRKGKDISPTENLKLYSGYRVGTQNESYAWIDLDKVKLAKLDTNSEVEVSKLGKKLELNVSSGNLFFNVAEPLADDETFNIRTSSMIVGIRGTCGWVAEDLVALLEGEVSVTAGSQSVTVSAGEMAVLTKEGKLEVTNFIPDDVPAFVVNELSGDSELAQAVFDATDLNIPAYSTASYEELLNTTENVVYSELIDFEQDGSPEFLMVLFEENSSQTHPFFGIEIYRNGPEGPQQLLRRSNSTSAMEQVICSLVESNGRLFVCCRVVGNYDYIQWWDDYYGSPAGQDGGPQDWGCTDSYTGFTDNINYLTAGAYSVSARPLDENGFVAPSSGGSSSRENVAAGKYTLVRELFEKSF